MLHLLARPLPFFYSRQHIAKLSLLVAVVVSLFLLLFRPVGIASDPRYSLLTASLVFGLLSGIMFGITYGTAALLGIQRQNWTLGKELGLYAILMIVVSLSSTIVRHFWVLTPDQSRIMAFLSDLSHTILIAIIPASIICLRLFWLQLPNDIKTSIRHYFISHVGKEPKPYVGSEISLLPQTGKAVSFLMEDLLYISADGNYVDVLINKDGVIQKEVLRATLKEIAEQLNDQEQLVRTHRAYLVNTAQVSEVTGNASGYKLKLKGLGDLSVPVSRKRIAAFDAVYNEL